MKKNKTVPPEKSDNGDLKLSKTYSSISKLASGLTESKKFHNMSQIMQKDKILK